MPMPMSTFINYQNPRVYGLSLESARYLISFIKKTYHLIQVVRSIQHTPDIVVLLLYVHDPAKCLPSGLF